MLLHSIEYQCVMEWLSCRVVNVEKQDNFPCRKALQRNAYRLFNCICVDSDISHIAIIWLIDYVCGMLIWRVLSAKLITYNKISTNKNKQIYFSIFSLFFSIDVLIFPTTVGTEGHFFCLR